jgi:hypothetical protein
MISLYLSVDNKFSPICSTW